MPELVLASTSPYRRALLGRLGLPFRAVAPEIDEDALKDPMIPPRILASQLARAKAESLVHAHPGAVIIGGDQLVAFEGRVFGKPGDQGRAVEQLLLMTGREHELITAIAVVHPRGLIEHVDITTLTMRWLSRSELERYVAADDPIDCAGSYKLEERGITLFGRIESADQSAVTGLPLIALTSILRELKFPIP